MSTSNEDRPSLVVRWIVYVIAAGMLAPLLLMVLVAFTGDAGLRVSNNFTLEWFKAFAQDEGWRSSLIVSLQVSVAATVVSVLFGVPMALGMTRSRGWLRNLAAVLTIAPIVVPGIAFAVASYLAWTRFGFADSRVGLILASIALALPFVVINAAAAAVSLDRNLESAARGLGASGPKVMGLIVLPLMRRGILAGALFAFLSAWDELIVAIFLTTPQVKTFPVRMWEHMNQSMTPVIPAAGSVLLLASLVALAINLILSRSRRAKSGA